MISADTQPTFNCLTCQFKFTDKNVFEDHVHNSHKDEHTLIPISLTNVKTQDNAIDAEDNTNPDIAKTML